MRAHSTLDPRHDELRPYLAYLAPGGVRYAISPALRREPDQTGSPHAGGPGWRHLLPPELPLPAEHRDAGARLASDHATGSVIAALHHDGLVQPGCHFWDIGTGTGLIAVAAALLGAGRVVATDLDPRCTELTRRNAATAGVTVVSHIGSLLEAVPAEEDADLVAANLPHKPSGCLASLHLAVDGGPEGDRVFDEFRRQCVARLRPGGRLVFFLHSLPHPRLLARLSDDFALTLLSWKRRILGQDEFSGLRAELDRRREAGTSYLGSDTDGRSFMVACVWVAERLGV